MLTEDILLFLMGDTTSEASSLSELDSSPEVDSQRSLVVPGDSLREVRDGAADKDPCGVGSILELTEPASLDNSVGFEGIEATMRLGPRTDGASGARVEGEKVSPAVANRGGGVRLLNSLVGADGRLVLPRSGAGTALLGPLAKRRLAAERLEGTRCSGVTRPDAAASLSLRRALAGTVLCSFWLA